MNFLVDAHLPRHLVLLLREHRYDAIHTLDLAEGNRTTDKQHMKSPGLSGGLSSPRMPISSILF